MIIMVMPFEDHSLAAQAADADPFPDYYYWFTYSFRRSASFFICFYVVKCYDDGVFFIHI